MHWMTKLTQTGILPPLYSSVFRSIRVKNQLLIATQNPGKIKEMKTLLAGLPAQLLTPKELGIQLVVEETGRTYQENAMLKAQAYAQVSGIISLADDSGLEVDALRGAPGLYSARFSPKPDATDADRRAYLLQKLQPHPAPWAARFRCVVAVVSPEQQPFFGEGVCEGEIIAQERGTNGFGYDPVFLLPQQARTMAELQEEEKNRLSHRALAVQSIKQKLKNVFAQQHIS